MISLREQREEYKSTETVKWISAMIDTGCRCVSIRRLNIKSESYRLIYSWNTC